MKLRRLLPRPIPDRAAAVKPEPTAEESAPRPAPAAAPAPRYWSLLLPPGFTSDRR